jgi:hypothetical protein
MPSDVLITPASSKIDFTDGSNATKRLNISGTAFSFNSNLNVLSSTSLSSAFKAEGVNGTLFEVIDDLSNSLMSVNTIGGLPVFEVFANNSIIAGQYNANDFVLTGNKIGIGTASPTGKLTIFQGNNPGITLFSNNAAQYAYLQIGRTSSELEIGVVSGSNQFFTGTVTADAVIKQNSTGKLHLGYGSAAPAVTVDSSNNIGIGTVSPTLTSGKGLHIYSSSGHTNLKLDNAGRIWELLATTGGYFSIYDSTSAADRLIISSSGNVGVGNTSPNNKLHVAGSASIGSSYNVAAPTNGLIVQGNVGIGTTSPSNRLDSAINVASSNHLGDANVYALAIKNYDATAGNAVGMTFGHGGYNYTNFVASIRTGTGANPKGDLVFGGRPADGSAFTENMRLQAGGNVGIGTASPLTLLDVRGGSITSGTATSTNGSTIIAGYYSNTAGVLTVLGTEQSSGGPVLGYAVTPSTSATGAFLSSTTITIPRSAYTQDGGTHRWYIGASQTVAIGGAVTTSEVMRINSSGNLGIGVTSPRALLDLAKTNNVGQVLLLGETGANIRVGFGLAPSNAGMRIFSLNHITDGLIEFGGISSSDGSTWTRNHRLGLAGANSFFNEQGGNVGIGTASPSQKLDIVGSYGVAGDDSGILKIRGGLTSATQLNFGVSADGGYGWIQATDVGATNNINIVLGPIGGNVGIGTVTPSAKLSTGATSGMKLLVYDNSSTGVYTGLGQDLAAGNSTDLFAHSVSNLGFITFGKIGTNGSTYTEWGRFNPSGNLGIGTTSPAAKLDIAGTNTTLALSFGITVPNNPLFINTYGGYSGIGMDSATAGIRLAGDYSGGTNPLVDIGYYTSGSVSHANWISRLKIINNGNVGIGAVTPNAKLESYFSSNALTFNYLATNFNNNSPIPTYSFDVTGGAETRSIKAGIGYERHLTNGRGAMHFYNDSVNDTSNITGSRSSIGDIKMTIQNDGNVGIGVVLPSYKLDVNGTTRFGGIVYNEAVQIDDFNYFNLQPYIESETLSSILSISGTAPTFTTLTNTTAPFSKVLSVSAYGEAAMSELIPVQAGETIYGEIWAYRATGAAGTAGVIYCGVQRFDKDKKMIDANAGLNTAPSGYFIASNQTIPSNSTWTKYSGTLVLPTSHTVYNTSDGGPVRYIRPYIIYNYTAGTILTYIGGWKIRKVQLTRDSGPVAINGNVGIGSDISSYSRLLLSTTSTTPTLNSTNPVDVSLIISNSDVAYGTMFATYGDGKGALQQRRTNAATYYDFSLQPHGGNVGIGNASPSYKLDVTGRISYNGAIGEGADATLSSSGTALLHGNSSTWTQQIFYTSGGERIRILSGGNVGIGTTNPATLLHVDTAGADARIRVSAGSNTVQGGMIANTNGLVYAGSITNHGFSLRTNDTDRVRIQTDGNVGIGATSPGYKLEVAGAIRSSFAHYNTSTDLNSLRGNLTTMGYTLTNTPSGAGWITVYTSQNNGGDIISQLGYDNYNQQKLFTRYSSDGGTTWSAWKTIINSDAVSGTTNYVAKFTGTNTLGNSVLYDNGANIGIGNTSPDLRVHIDATNAYPASSGTASNGYLILRAKTAGGTHGMYLGVGNASPYGSWIQCSDSTNLATNYPLLLNPNGGNVGIGLTSPTASLHIKPASISANGFILERYASTAKLIYAYEYAADGYLEVRNGSDQIVSKISGYAATATYFQSNVGIGTTNPLHNLHIVQSIPTGAIAAPTNTTLRLDSNSNNYLSFVNTSDNSTYAGLTFTDNNVGGYIVFRNYTGDVLNGSDSLIYGTYQDHIFQTGTASGVNSRNEVVRIKNNGNVGIGSNAPANKLHVNGSTSIGSSYNTAAPTNGLIVEGNVGIGVSTLNAGAKLHVVGNADIGDSTADTGIIVRHGSGSAQYGRIRFYSASTNIHTIHSFPTAWNGGTFLNASAGAMNLQGTNGITFGSWNSIDVAFAQGGNNYFKGNVGIGITVPSAILHVNSTASGATLLRADGTNGTLFSVIDDLSDSLMSVNNSAGLPVLEVFADDRVVAGQYGANDFVLVNNKLGLGTNNPAYRLNVYDISSGSVDEVFVGTIGSDQVVGGRTGGSFGISTKSTSNGNLILTANSAMYLRTGGGNDRVFIKSDGNVGIGTVTPAFKLDVNGTFNATGTSTLAAVSITGSITSSTTEAIRINNNNGYISIYNSAGTTRTGYIQGLTAGSLVLSAENGALLQFLVGGSERARIDTSGNIGIGTTTGTFTLNVYNNADVWHARFGGITGEVRIGGQTNSGAVIQAFVPVSGTFRDLYIQRDGGNVGIGTNSPAALLQIGTGTPTAATGGIQFGGDTGTRLYRSASGIITCSGTIAATFSGALTGNVTGNVSGSSGSCTGNAAGSSTFVAGLGVLNYDIDRTTKRVGLSHYTGYSTGTNRPTTYDYTLQVTDGSKGWEISMDWIATTGPAIYARSLRDCCQNWSSWVRILDSANYSFAANMNQNVRTTDNVTFGIVTATFSGALTGNVTGNVSGTAGGETLGTVTGRGASTSTQITVSTAAGGSMYTGIKSGASYGDGISGATFKSITDNPSGGSYAFAAYFNGVSGTNSFFVAADGSGYLRNSLGIGTTAPAATLQVWTGSPTASGNGIQFGDDTGARLYRSSSGVVSVSNSFAAAGGYVYASNYLQTGNNLIYPASFSATQRLEVGNTAQNAWIDGITIAPGGNVVVAGTLTESSSIRYKENIQTISAPILPKLNEIRPVTYNKKDNPNNIEYGIIAEELNDLFPELVNKNNNGEVESVNYSRLTVLLIKAVKELKQEIEILKNK